MLLARSHSPPHASCNVLPRECFVTTAYDASTHSCSCCCKQLLVPVQTRPAQFNHARTPLYMQAAAAPAAAPAAPVGASSRHCCSARCGCWLGPRPLTAPAASCSEQLRGGAYCRLRVACCCTGCQRPRRCCPAAAGAAQRLLTMLLAAAVAAPAAPLLLQVLPCSSRRRCSRAPAGAAAAAVVTAAAAPRHVAVPAATAPAVAAAAPPLQAPLLQAPRRCTGGRASL